MVNLIKILVVEDEMLIAAKISMLLINMGYSVTGILPRGEEAIASIEIDRPDIVLLDINLSGDIDGIETAKQMGDIPVIYLTANADEATFNRAKVTKPSAFISKPFKQLDLQRAIELTISRMGKQHTDGDISLNEIKPFILNDCIFVRYQEKMVKVTIKDILYIEAERNYSRIHCKEKEFLLAMALKEMEDKLPHDYFLRVHRSFIVNISHIDEIAVSHVIIAKKAIPLSVELKKHLLQRIQKL